MSVLHTDLLFSSSARVARQRFFCGEATVLVREGQRVNADTVVARGNRPDHLRAIDVAGELGIPASKLADHICVDDGDWVDAGDLVAEARYWLAFRRRVTAPVHARVQSIHDGLVLLRVPRSKKELTAGMPGVVHRIHHGRGVTIVAGGAHLRGCWGSDGYGLGPLKFASCDTEGWLVADQVRPWYRGSIVIARRVRELEVIQRAAGCLVRGLVVGSMPRRLAHRCGSMGLPVLVTEGFGDTPMSEAVCEGLRKLCEKGAVLFGAEPRHQLLPELVVPRAPAPETALTPYRQVSVGATVRVTAGEHRGAIGFVCEVPAGLVRTALGDWVSGVFVRLAGGGRVFAALPNIQVLVRDGEAC